MIKRTSKGKVYYYCSNYYRTKNCENNKSISKSILDEFIKKELNITEVTRLNINNNIKYINVVSNYEIVNSILRNENYTGTLFQGKKILIKFKKF